MEGQASPTPPRRNLLPFAAAVLVWIALLGATCSPALWTSVNERLQWMMQPVFHDWHVVRGGWAAWAVGIDPLADLANPFNYPRTILLVAGWGGSAIPANVAGLGLAAALLATLAWILRARGWRQGVAFAAMIVSFPVLLLIERGNLDQVALVLTVGGLLVLARDRQPDALQFVGVAALVMAALLKLYPLIVLAGGVLYWRDSRRGWLGLGLLAVLFWCGVHLDEIALVMRKTTQGVEPAYGRLLLNTRYRLEHGTAILSPGRYGLAVMLMMGGVIAAATWGFLTRATLNKAMPDPRERALALGGALVYVGTYLLGSNWSYRLVFLLLCAPALWTSVRAGGGRWWAGGALLGIFLSLFSPIHLPWPAFVFIQLVQYALMLVLVSVAVALMSGGSLRTASEGAAR